MSGGESAVARAKRGWAQHWQTRHLIAAWFAILGALAWLMQAFGMWMQSQEGKWQNNDYLSVGDSTITADNLMSLLCVAFLLVTALLGGGAVYLLRGRTSGRYPVMAGAWLVTLGQLFAAVLAWIPIDAFYHSTPPNPVFMTPLVIFPLLTILLLTGRADPSDYPIHQ
ncbi:hypothetical protein [Nocardia sp. NPDC127526]|uniref:hypothetical protein n=1 Tax=Nocardia sp. NPDC127526 TaxID=3345393 RepID=UPI003644EB0A